MEFSPTFFEEGNPITLLREIEAETRPSMSYMGHAAKLQVKTMPKHVTPMMVNIVLRRHARVAIPEQALWLEVVLQAAREWNDVNHKGPTRGFVESERFEKVCEFVDLPSAFARKIIARIGEPTGA